MRVIFSGHREEYSRQ